MPKKTAEKQDLITLAEAELQMAKNMTNGNVEMIRQEVISQIFNGSPPKGKSLKLKFLEPHFAFLDYDAIRYSISARVENILDRDAVRKAGIKLQTPEEARKFMRPQLKISISSIKIKPPKKSGEPDEDEQKNSA